MPTASLDKKPEVVVDTVYQLQMPNGEFKRKYVKTVRTYGEGEEKKADAVIVHDLDNPENEGLEVKELTASLLGIPNIYPKFMFQPNQWTSRAKQSKDEVLAEVDDVLDSWFAVNPVVAFDLSQDADMIVNSIKEMLSGYFGPFMLGMLAHWIKRKIENRIETSGGSIHPKPFERKLGTIKKELAERRANLALPQNERGAYNLQHPFGKPREVEQFGQPQA
jgi:hypothetical protein